MMTLVDPKDVEQKPGDRRRQHWEQPHSLVQPRPVEQGSRIYQVLTVRPKMCSEMGIWDGTPEAFEFNHQSLKRFNGIPGIFLGESTRPNRMHLLNS